MALVNANGKTWGMSPWSARYYYLTMVRSAFSYLSFIWHHVCPLKSVQDNLKTFQRLAFKVMGPIWPGTPTRGLEVLCQVRLLELELRHMAAEQYLRTKDYQLRLSAAMKTKITSRKGHRQWYEEFLKLIGCELRQNKTAHSKKSMEKVLLCRLHQHDLRGPPS